MCNLLWLVIGSHLVQEWSQRRVEATTFCRGHEEDSRKLLICDAKGDDLFHMFFV